MKHLFVFLLVAGPIFPAIAQVDDDFSDGDFTNLPSWTGDDSRFEVNASLELHLNAPAVTDTTCLATAHTIVLNTEWYFYCLLDFTPSNSNFLKVYLVSDQANFRQPL